MINNLYAKLLKSSFSSNSRANESKVYEQYDLPALGIWKLKVVDNDSSTRAHILILKKNNSIA
jgi:hypothetical protein